jgi:preprotein translocase subunit SecA
MNLGGDLEEVLNSILLKATPEELLTIEMKKSEFASNGDRDSFMRTARGVMLQSIDLFWIDHLEFMDYMRSSVNLRAYGQRDPLVEYKREGLKLFKDMEYGVDHEIIRILTTIQGQVGLGQNIETIELKPDAEQYINGGSREVEGITLGEGRIVPIVSGEEKVGRNDMCPCGSGKKYKKCHGA